MERKNEIDTDKVLGENDRKAPMDDNKIVRKDTDVVPEKTNADVVQEMKHPALTLSSSLKLWVHTRINQPQT